MKNKNYRKKGSLKAAVIAATILLNSGVIAEASDSFLSEVKCDDWSYQAINQLIEAGAVPDYTVKIPEGRSLSRLEMAVIVDAAMKNQANMNTSQQAVVQKLSDAYYYDRKKIALLDRLDHMDAQSIDKLSENANHTLAKDTGLTEQEKTDLKKAADFADKFSITGNGLLRNDHYLRDTGKSTRANMVQVQVFTTYKVNPQWQIHTDLGYRNSFSGFDETKSSDPGENQTGTTMDTYLTGRMFNDALGVKIGKWNEWNIYGWGMDIDCDFSGLQLEYGKKAFKTFFTTGKMDLWDNLVPPGDRCNEQVTSLRAFYPFDQKNDINFGFAWSSAMASRGQDPAQGRVFYYYTHAHHKFDKNWDLRVGLINSNAKRDNTVSAGAQTKHPGRWIQLEYKGIDLQKPGSYGVTADYRYEPALTWPTLTDWCGLNEKFLRVGVSYVPAKNIVLNTFYTWARNIDTNARNDMYRFQAQFFF